MAGSSSAKTRGACHRAALARTRWRFCPAMTIGESSRHDPARRLLRRSRRQDRRRGHASGDDRTPLAAPRSAGRMEPAPSRDARPRLVSRSLSPHRRAMVVVHAPQDVRRRIGREDPVAAGGRPRAGAGWAGRRPV